MSRGSRVAKNRFDAPWGYLASIMAILPIGHRIFRKFANPENFSTVAPASQNSDRDRNKAASTGDGNPITTLPFGLDPRHSVSTCESDHPDHAPVHIESAERPRAAAGGPRCYVAYSTETRNARLYIAQPQNANRARLFHSPEKKSRDNSAHSTSSGL